MFTDEIEIVLKAGNGGNGRVSFFPGKKSGPDGGNGGDGGDLYIKVSSSLTNLNHLVGKHQIKAEDAQAGGGNKRSGPKGKDLVLNLPIGSLLIDTQTGQELELTGDNQKILICNGGKGGKGNAEFKSAAIPAPRVAKKGEPGQKKHFKILLRLIADFGLIGLPNTGKSSLLNELTNAKVKVANYPFTTLEPNLGVLNGKIIADIPGLIEGASTGRGLGIKFLKHIQKVSLLLHCISSESIDVVKDYQVVIQEMQEFDPQITQKKQIILLTKSDLIDNKDVNEKLKQLKKIQTLVLAVSIYNWESLKDLLKIIDIPINGSKV